MLFLCPLLVGVIDIVVRVCWFVLLLDGWLGFCLEELDMFFGVGLIYLGNRQEVVGRRWVWKSSGIFCYLVSALCKKKKEMAIESRNPPKYPRCTQ